MTDINFIPNTDYRSRTIVEVLNPRWANAGHTILDADVLFEELRPIGHIPFTAVDGADTDHGQEIWDKAIAGDYGIIAIYVPAPELSPEEQRAQMPPLEKWRFDTIIDSRPGLRDKIESAIDRNISDLLQRATVRNKFRSVTQFSRLDPMFPFLASDPDINISDLEIDEMWRQGLALT